MSANGDVKSLYHVESFKENCIQSIVAEPVFVGCVNAADAVVVVTVITPIVGCPGDVPVALIYTYDDDVPPSEYAAESKSLFEFLALTLAR